MKKKMSFDEYHAHLREIGDLDCSCHLHPPCQDCIDASSLYEEYLELEESE